MTMTVGEITSLYEEACARAGGKFLYERATPDLLKELREAMGKALLNAYCSIPAPGTIGIGDALHPLRAARLGSRGDLAQRESCDGVPAPHPRGGGRLRNGGPFAGY